MTNTRDLKIVQDKGAFEFFIFDGDIGEVISAPFPTLTQAHAALADEDRQAYEVMNPSFSDLRLEQQIEHGINDWCAEGANGHPYYGRSKAQAEETRDQYESQRFA